jgi:hypothetical protein
MDRDEVTAKRTENETALTEVASLIRPLPDNVTPSEEFMRRMRIRLLKLEAKPSVGRQAA